MFGWASDIEAGLCGGTWKERDVVSSSHQPPVQSRSSIHPSFNVAALSSRHHQ